MKRYCARLCGTLGGVLLAAGIASGQPIKLGELNSYKTFPAFLEPYRKGMELAGGQKSAALSSRLGATDIGKETQCRERWSVRAADGERHRPRERQ